MRRIWAALTWGVSRPPLSFPDPAHLPAVEVVWDYPAVTLLLHRAQARRAEVTLTVHNAPAVAQICARLDGISLALELATARLSALSLEQVAARLDDCFRLLTAGSRTAVPRQRTLRATLDWSYALLDPSEQVLLAPGLRARPLIGIGYLKWLQGDGEGAESLFEASLGLYRALGDTGGSAEALYYLAMTVMDRAMDQGSYAQAQGLYEEGLTLFQERGDAWAMARTLRRLARIAENQHDYGRATALLEHSLRLARQVGQPTGIIESLYMLGDVATEAGDVERAGPLLDESVALARIVGDEWNLIEALIRIGLWARQAGDSGRAQMHFEESLALARIIGSPFLQANALFLLSCLAIERGDAAQALELAAASMGLSRRMWEPALKVAALKVLAIAAVATGQPAHAARLVGAHAAMAGIPAEDDRLPTPQLYERALADARAARDEDAFATAWAQGAAMTLEEAITYALGLVGSVDGAPIVS